MSELSRPHDEIAELRVQVEQSIKPADTAKLITDSPDSDYGWYCSEIPDNLAKVIALEYDEEDRERLAEAALKASIANMKPNSQYADVMARDLAMDAIRYALGLKQLPVEGEQ